MQIADARLIARELQLTGSGQRVGFHGRSMEPFLLDGDDLQVAPVDWNEVEIGDIVTYRLDERFPTLRVIGRGRSKLVLRGDNWPFADFDIWPEHLLGRVVARHRNGRTLQRTDLAWRVRTRLALLEAGARNRRRGLAEQIRRLRRVAARLARGEPPRNQDPHGIHVNVSASCNLACKMCPYLEVHGDTAYVREMTEETFRHLLPVLPRLPSLLLSGSGEPFFNRRLLTFIRLAREANPSIEISVTTNGTLLTESVIRSLIELRLTRLAISIDGVHTDTTEGIRLGVNAQKVWNNLRSLQRIKRETGSRWPIVRLNYVLGYGTYDEFPDFIRAAVAEGVDEVHALEVFCGTEDAYAHNALNSIARDGGRRLREAWLIAQGHGLKITLPTTQRDACMHPTMPHVSEAGVVSPCCYVDYEGRTLWNDGQSHRAPHLDYGSIAAQPFARIWTSAEFEKFRAQTRAGKLEGFCRRCHAVRLASSDAVTQAMN